jgi:N-acetylmuramoyl-L-alanine amidase
MTVGLLIGHTPDEKGATHPGTQIQEWDFNFPLVQRVHRALDDSKIILRGRPNDWGGLPSRVNESGVDVCVSFHLNAYKGDAKGSEVLCWPDDRSVELANALQTQIVLALGTRDRGVKTRTEGRGSHLLEHTEMDLAIVEPFFIDDQLQSLAGRMEDLAKAYIRAIRDFQSEYGPLYD